MFVVLLRMLHLTQQLEPPANPARFRWVFLSAFQTGSEARSGIGSWIEYYNRRRPHPTFAGRTPDEVYATAGIMEKLAA